MGRQLRLVPCDICFDRKNIWIKMPCPAGHYFCIDCVLTMIARDKNALACPTDRCSFQRQMGGRVSRTDPEGPSQESIDDRVQSVYDRLYGFKMDHDEME